jgi:6-phosphogluconate dehydrogenase
MQLGMIGLGRMGGNIVRRLMRQGHSTVVYDKDAKAVAGLAADGAVGSTTLEEFISKLERPRTAWVMLPAGRITETTIETIAAVMQAGDVIIDGGNTFWQDDVRRGKALKARGIHYVDVGTSGGVWGLERGYCQMVGGERDVVKRLDPVLSALAPTVDSVPRTPGRKASGGTAEHGYLHCGPAGAGHFVKMVHNGIEYGLMAAYAEGLNILKGASIGKDRGAADAETTPLRDPEHFRYDFDIAEITELWRRGSVVGSWLLDLTAGVLARDPALEGFAGRVSDSGEGRWTVHAAIDEGVPAPVLTAALYQRFSSRGNAVYADKVLSAMRHAFGGHVEKHS